MQEEQKIKSSHAAISTFKTVLMALSLTVVIVGFQNCNDKVNFRSTESVSSLQTELSSTTEDRDSSSSTAESEISSSRAGLAVHKVGENYGACTLQLEQDFDIIHNGILDKNGNRISTVPEGVGGATWPITSCPNTGNYKTNPIQCASGFKPALLEYSQMDCRTGTGAAACATYWVTYACTRLATGTVRPPESSSPSGEYAAGAIAGSCHQQFDGDFVSLPRSSANSILSETNSGVVWPVTHCPEDKTNLAVTCAAGWKPATQSFQQFICPGTLAGAVCNQYVVRSSCIKL